MAILTAAEYLRDWKRRNRAKVVEYHKRYMSKNPEVKRVAKVKATQAWRSRNIESARATDAAAKRELRKSDPVGQKVIKNRSYAKKVEAMANRPRALCCELCGLLPGFGSAHKTTVFDHCHVTGNFRGWLCDRCNKVLGLVKEDENLLLKMRDYLVRSGYGSSDISSEKISA